ncbi:MAG: hypothetical protein ABEJ31_14120 [Haloarculaceae archaeon]
MAPSRSQTDGARSRVRGNGKASAAAVAAGAAAGLAAAGGLALWYASKHSPAGYATWSRREETVAPDSLVFSWRRPDRDDVAPPF